ncbi:UDP-glycosyltransferase family, conserved site [Sesbania bispinosa]|nr:UDP-glycosyltransferase family, conserved site [Sesbania bispinosa]
MEGPQSAILKQTLPPLVAMMPSPGMGHLIPMIELAKRLTSHHNLPVTFIIPTHAPPSNPQTTLLHSLPPPISHLFLPPVTLPPNTTAESLISLTILLSLPSLRQTLISLTASNRVTAFIVDSFGTDAFDVAAELNIPPYLYFLSNAMALSFCFYLPHLDRQVHCQFKDLPEPINIPGCIPLHGKDLLDPLQDRNNDAYKLILHHSNRCRLAQGVLVNTFSELEPEAIMSLQKDEPGKPPVYPVGPLVNEDCAQTGDGDQILRWLDEQPRGSVIFVCFGSGGTLSGAQMEELAYGLEMSEQRFVWVVKNPNDKIANGCYFSAGNNNVDHFDFLPKGFIERIRGKGLLVPSWAPQALILSHSSTGGFLTHCGWNSILESVVNGVPLVAWPLYAEQKMNAVLVTQGIKVALRAEVGENGLVEREEIASVVKTLMEGEDGKKLHYRMRGFKEAADRALKENGSSTKQIAELALKWKGQTTISN